MYIRDNQAVIAKPVALEFLYEGEPRAARAVIDETHRPNGSTARQEPRGRRHESVVTTAGRGQTEPLAALVAVFAVCLAVSVYAGFLTGLSGADDRELAASTGERVWDQLADNGVYHANEEIELGPEALPAGRNVSVNVTSTADDGHRETVGEAQFDESGTAVEPVATGGEVFRRPVAVKHGEGELRPGVLTVVVSDGRS